MFHAINREIQANQNVSPSPVIRLDFRHYRLQEPPKKNAEQCFQDASAMMFPNCSILLGVAIKDPPKTKMVKK